MTFKYVETLDTFINKFKRDDSITYEMLQDFINCIVSQYYMLGDYNKTIYAANFDNILVFDNEFFIFMEIKNTFNDAQGFGIDDIGLGIVDFNLKGNCLITKQMLSILKKLNHIFYHLK